MKFNDELEEFLTDRYAQWNEVMSIGVTREQMYTARSCNYNDRDFESLADLVEFIQRF